MDGIYGWYRFFLSRYHIIDTVLVIIRLDINYINKYEIIYLFLFGGIVIVSHLSSDKHYY